MIDLWTRLIRRQLRVKIVNNAGVELKAQPTTTLPRADARLSWPMLFTIQSRRRRRQQGRNDSFRNICESERDARVHANTLTSRVSLSLSLLLKLQFELTVSRRRRADIETCIIGSRSRGDKNNGEFGGTLHRVLTDLLITYRQYFFYSNAALPPRVCSVGYKYGWNRKS